ncbi:unnamed protein product [Gordionus sp. m RMFG-2023]
MVEMLKCNNDDIFEMVERSVVIFRELKEMKEVIKIIYQDIHKLINLNSNGGKGQICVPTRSDGKNIFSGNKNFFEDLKCTRCWYKGHKVETCVVKEQNFREGFLLRKLILENSNVRKISGTNTNKLEVPQSNYGKSRWCFMCNMPGHVAINCTEN